jgi:hypothetical protein
MTIMTAARSTVGHPAWCTDHHDWEYAGGLAETVHSTDLVELIVDADGTGPRPGLVGIMRFDTITEDGTETVGDTTVFCDVPDVTTLTPDSAYNLGVALMRAARNARKAAA